MQHDLSLLISTNKQYLWPNTEQRFRVVTQFNANTLNSCNQVIPDFFPQGQMDSDIIVAVLYHTPLHKGIGRCTSIPVTAASDCSWTSQNQQENLHKIFLKSFFIENPATSLSLLRRKLKHKHHFKRGIFRSSYDRLSPSVYL